MWGHGASWQLFLPKGQKDQWDGRKGVWGKPVQWSPGSGGHLGAWSRKGPSCTQQGLSWKPSLTYGGTSFIETAPPATSQVSKAGIAGRSMSKES